MRIIGGRVRRKAARGAVLEPLVNGQDNHLARATKFAVHQDAAEVGFRAGIVGFVVGQDFLNDARGSHDGPFGLSNIIAHTLSAVSITSRNLAAFNGHSMEIVPLKSG